MEGQSVFYPVEDVLGRKLINGKVHYLIKWKDFPADEATWEYTGDLPFIRPLIRGFNAKQRFGQSRQKGSANVSAMLEQLWAVKSDWQEDAKGDMRPYASSTFIPNDAQSVTSDQSISNLIVNPYEDRRRRPYKAKMKKRMGWQASSCRTGFFPNVAEKTASPERHSTVSTPQKQSKDQ